MSAALPCATAAAMPAPVKNGAIPFSTGFLTALLGLLAIASPILGRDRNTID